MLSRRLFLTRAVVVPIIALIATAAEAETAPIYATDGVAVDGSDVVAYFTQGASVQGSPEFSYDWREVTWYFANVANRDAFAAEPAAFAPQYGGYCAWAVSEGYTASTVPEAWRIVDGKLYLNFSRRIQGRWERDIPTRIKAADANWPAVLD